jgi:hypothetical protein
MAHDIIGDLRAGAVGWTDWNLLVDADGGPSHNRSADDGCDAQMIVRRAARYRASAGVDDASEEADSAEQAGSYIVHRQPTFWYMRHFAGIAAASVVPSRTDGVNIGFGAAGPDGLRNGDALAVGPCETDLHIGASSLQQWELATIADDNLFSQLRQCTGYTASAKCEWTAEWGCSAATPGTSGVARDDGSTGYFCCCIATGRVGCSDSAAANQALAASGTGGSTCAAASSRGLCSGLRVALLCAQTCGLCAKLASTDAVGHEAAGANDRDTVGGAMMVRLRGTDLCVDVTDGKLMVHNPLQVRTWRIFMFRSASRLLLRWAHLVRPNASCCVAMKWRLAIRAPAAANPRPRQS